MMLKFVQALAASFSVLALTHTGLCAQTSAGTAGAASLRDRFIGTWKLVATEQRNAKGEVVPPAPGSRPRTGYLIYDPAGYVAVSIMPMGRTKYAQPQPTEAEAQAAMAGYAGYFGTFTIDAAKGIVTHHLEGSVNPGMGSNQLRGFELSGNRLTLKPPAAANGDQSRLTWERLPVLATPSAEQRKFFGFWKLISSERRNSKGEVLSSNPGQTGYIIYTPAGFMMVHMIMPNRNPYSAQQPTPAEAKQLIATYTNYFGPFYVHAEDGYLVHDQVGYLNLGRNGPTPFQRFYTFTGNRLLLHPPLTDTPDGQTIESTITWERAPAVTPQ